MYQDPAGVRTPTRKESGRVLQRHVFEISSTETKLQKSFVLSPLTPPYAAPQSIQEIATLKQAALVAQRMAAIESDVKHLLSGAPRRLDLVPREYQERRTRRAPYAVIRNSATDRYRLPRPWKSALINRFCADPEELVRESPRTLIVVAHQDDESIGAGARLCHLTDATIVHVTDGAPRDPAVALRYGYATRDEYAEARHREVLNALTLAGVPHERLVSLGFVDGEASLRMVELCLKLTDLFDSVEPDIVITHPYEGGHTDHDATAFAVHLACGILRREGRRPPAVLELTSYHNTNGQRVAQEFLPHDRADKGQRLILLSDEEQELKQKMFACFESQQVVMQTFSTAFEKFRPAPRYVFTEPPHPGPLNYERYGNPRRGAFWRNQAEQALRTLRMRKR